MAIGQHIKVKRPDGWVAVGMVHHGIDIGDGTVIHFTGMSTPTAKVIRTNMKIFESNGVAEVVSYEKIKNLPPAYFGDYLIDYSKLVCRSPDEVIYYAFQSLGMGNYSAYGNNCEHFATCMMTGVPFSLQSQNVSSFLDRRPTLGGLLASTLIEFFRFRNPHAKPVNGLNYTSSIYYYEKCIFLEKYTSIGVLPPKWFYSSSPNNSWSLIDQKKLPYPLNEIARYYVDRNNQQYVETSDGLFTLS